MTSHEYANRLEKLAAELKSKSDFELPDYSERYYGNYGIETFRYNNQKEGFLQAARALGSGTKDGTADELTFKHGDIRLSVDRNVVCKLVRPAEYECEPLLSEAETAEIG